MKREDLMNVYEPKEGLDMRVKNVLNTLEERSVCRTSVKRIAVVAALSR